MTDFPAFSFASILVDKFYDARRQDFLPDHDTERALGMSGSSSSVGRLLYQSTITLMNHGRICKTMMMQALCHSETSFPEYMELWLRSLPPHNRSYYTADLMKTKFDCKWDYQIYKRLSEYLVRGDKFDVPPPIPLGDDRHSPLRAAIAHHASYFFTLLSTGTLTDGDGLDVNAPLCRESIYEPLQEIGAYFGVHVVDLNWETGAESRVQTMSYSELILRIWYALYLNIRLSVTQLEHALVHESTGMKELLDFSIHVHLTYSKQPPQMMQMMGSIYCNELLQRGLSGARFEQVQVGPGDKPDLTCDYCGDEISKALRCSRCHCAMYCNRDCQKSDFKRHKPLCLRLAKATDEESTESKKPAAKTTP